MFGSNNSSEKSFIETSVHTTDLAFSHFTFQAGPCLMWFGVNLKLLCVYFPFHPTSLRITHSHVCNSKRQLPLLAATAVYTPCHLLSTSLVK